MSKHYQQRRQDDRQQAQPSAAPVVSNAASASTAKADARPTYDELRAAAKERRSVSVKLANGRGPLLVAGIVCSDVPRVVAVQSIVELGDSHVRALALDPMIDVRFAG